MGGLVVGIDLGTSSVKVLCLGRSGVEARASEGYGNGTKAADGDNPSLWWEGLVRAFKRLEGAVDLSLVEAVGLTSQVGTYLLYDPEKEERDFRVVSWRSGNGWDQLVRLKKSFDREYFIRHISMPHPDLACFPVPRIHWFKEQLPEEWEKARLVLQPKDYLYHKLTGCFGSDPYSWRGLSDSTGCGFSDAFLKDTGVPRDKLPPMYKPTEAPGRLLGPSARTLGLRAGIPVFMGCNDFFSALLGMGIHEEGQCFDVCGTSEHVGLISRKLHEDTRLVSGPYFKGFAHYGVTANSGSSMSWAARNFGDGVIRTPSMERVLKGDKAALPPLFLPYLKGERAPVWDTRARGVFFGLEPATGKEELLYSVMEGVVFSLYHIWEGLNPASPGEMRVAGGAAFDDDLNLIKASLFKSPFLVMEEKESAAMGAAIFAGTGAGWFASLEDAAESWVRVHHLVLPDERYFEALQRRFEVYKSLYPLLKDAFLSWSRVRGGD